MSRSRLLTLAVLALALLLLAGPALSTAVAQEKGREKPKEEKEKSKVYTNRDLKKTRSSSGGGESPSAGGDAAAAPGDEVQPGEEATVESEDPWASVGVATDSQGRGEDYWRQAMTDARNAVTTARAEKDQLQSEMNRSRVDFTAIDDPAARALVDQRIKELHDELAAADRKVADAEQALRDLEDEARRSGALPGWLR